MYFCLFLRLYIVYIAWHYKKQNKINNKKKKYINEDTNLPNYVPRLLLVRISNGFEVFQLCNERFKSQNFFKKQILNKC